MVREEEKRDDWREGKGREGTERPLWLRNQAAFLLWGSETTLVPYNNFLLF